MDELHTGDTEQSLDAGETAAQEIDYKAMLGLDEQTGDTEETPDDAGREEPSQDEPDDLPDEQQTAFQKRLERESRKIEERLRQEFEERYAQQTQPQNNELALADQLAYQLGITREAAAILIHQQIALNNMQDTAAKHEARAEVEAMRRENEHLPEWNEAKLSEIRKDYQAKYGTTLPWTEAYHFYIAQEAISGKISHAAEQKAISNITRRNKATVQAGGAKSAKAPDIWDMDKEEFEKMVERAKSGEFQKL